MVEEAGMVPGETGDDFSSLADSCGRRDLCSSFSFSVFVILLVTYRGGRILSIRGEFGYFSNVETLSSRVLERKEQLFKWERIL